jgi:hypothetical protein
MEDNSFNFVYSLLDPLTRRLIGAKNWLMLVVAKFVSGFPWKFWNAVFSLLHLTEIYLLDPLKYLDETCCTLFVLGVQNVWISLIFTLI